MPPPRNITSPAPAGVLAGRGHVVGECQRTTADGEIGESVSFLLMGWKLEIFRLVGKRESSRISIAFCLIKKQKCYDPRPDPIYYDPIYYLTSLRLCDDCDKLCRKNSMLSSINSVSYITSSTKQT